MAMNVSNMSAVNFLPRDTSFLPRPNDGRPQKDEKFDGAVFQTACPADSRPRFAFTIVTALCQEREGHLTAICSLDVQSVGVEHRDQDRSRADHKCGRRVRLSRVERPARDEP